MTEGKKYIGLAEIQAAQDQGIVEIDVPEWGGVAKIGTLTAGDRNKLESSMFRDELVTKESGETEVRRVATGVNFRTLLVGLCLINGDGHRVCDDDEIKMLDARNAQVIDRLFTAAQKLNALQAGAVEDAKKD